MLLELLKQEAISKGLIPESTSTLTEPMIFFLVRDMPYKRASSRDPKVSIQEWKGTCSGKHYLLKALYEEMGYTARLMACSHYISDAIIQKLPADIQVSFQEKRVPDIHNYLILELSEGCMIIDATWPPEAEAYGLTINKVFELGKDMAISGEPLEHFEFPDGVDPQDYKEELLSKKFSREELKSREAFFNLIT